MVSLILVALSFLSSYQVLGSEVPTILWNIKGNSVQLRPVSAFGNDQKMFEESLRDLLQKDAGILVFTVNMLSMEDFSTNEKSYSQNDTLQNLQTFLDLHPYMLLPTVRDPMQKIHEVHCGVEEIIVSQAVTESVMQSVSTALERSCVVILHLSDTSVVPKAEARDVFLPGLEKINRNVVGMFTAKKSSWEVNSDHHKFRNLLGIADSLEDVNFMNISGCLIAYAENASIGLQNGNETVQFIFPPDLDGSLCSNSTPILVMKFKTSDSAEVFIQLDFGVKGGAWVTNKTSISFQGGKFPEGPFELEGKLPGASLGFSFSCGDFVTRILNISAVLTFNRFQIQPFGVNGGFSDSFDCVPFFTIPIWMGIFVAILFIVIMNIGIYALFSVHTMDRFDDPKGKTITVAASD